MIYQAWGWPVTHQSNEVWLTLKPDTVALLIPCRTQPASPQSCANVAAHHPCWPTLTLPNTGSHSSYGREIDVFAALRTCSMSYGLPSAVSEWSVRGAAPAILRYSLISSGEGSRPTDWA